MRLPTGVKRLDELLKGGLPEKSATLLYGPPFIGKETLSRLYALSSLKAGVPALLILTDASAVDVKKQMAGMDPSFPQYDKAGLVYMVDTYSRTIGAAENMARVEYVDGLLNFNAVSVAVNNAQRDIIRNHANHALAFDSVSTLIAYTNPGTAFRFLQVLLGKSKTAGATSLLHLEQGMHADPDVQMLKHLADGVIELRTEGDKNLIRIEGLGVTESRAWVEYRFNEQKLEITGSFAAGRIR